MKAGGEGRGEPASDGDGDRRGEQGLAAKGGASVGTRSGKGGASAAAPAGGEGWGAPQVVATEEDGGGGGGT